MILDLVLIGLAITLEPLPFTAIFLVLASERGVRKGAAFVFGLFLSLAAVIALTVLATGNQSQNPEPRRRRPCSPLNSPSAPGCCSSPCGSAGG